MAAAVIAVTDADERRFGIQVLDAGAREGWSGLLGAPVTEATSSRAHREIAQHHLGKLELRIH